MITYENSAKILGNSLEFQSIQLINEYLNIQGLNRNMIERILDPLFIKYNPKYYLYYPMMFVDDDLKQKSSKIKYLTIASFLYYRATIEIDNFLDEKDGGK